MSLLYKQYAQLDIMGVECCGIERYKYEAIDLKDVSNHLSHVERLVFD